MKLLYTSSYKFLILVFIFTVKNLNAQEDFNLEETKAELAKFQQDPRLYYDKINSLKSQIKEANQNSLNVAEEYITLLNQKDSLIEIYKKRLKTKAAQEASMPSPSKIAKTKETKPSPSQPEPKSTPNSDNQSSNNSLSSAQVGSKYNPLDNNSYPYRVQIASFKSNKLANILKNPKIFYVTTLVNRNVFEISGFESPEEANIFAQELKSSDIKNAFVTKYHQGKRVEDYDVLDELGKASSIKNKKSIQKNTSNSELTSDFKSNSSDVEYPTGIPNGYREMKGLAEQPKEPTKINPSIANSSPAPNHPKNNSLSSKSSVNTQGMTSKTSSDKTQNESTNSQKPNKIPNKMSKLNLEQNKTSEESSNVKGANSERLKEVFDAFFGK